MRRPISGDQLPTRSRVVGLVLCGSALFGVALSATGQETVDGWMMVGTNAAMVIAISEVLRGRS